MEQKTVGIEMPGTLLKRIEELTSRDKLSTKANGGFHYSKITPEKGRNLGKQSLSFFMPFSPWKPGPVRFL